MDIDPNNADAKNGMATTQMEVSNQAYGNNKDAGSDEERMQRAMADPEIQKIMRDPNMQLVLQKMGNDPSYAQSAMSDPNIKHNIEMLINAGVVKLGK